MNLQNAAISPDGTTDALMAVANAIAMDQFSAEIADLRGDDAGRCIQLARVALEATLEWVRADLAHSPTTGDGS